MLTNHDKAETWVWHHNESIWNSFQVLAIIISQSSKESIIHLSQVKGFLSKPEENITQFYLKNQ